MIDIIILLAMFGFAIIAAYVLLWFALGTLVLLPFAALIALSLYAFGFKVTLWLIIAACYIYYQYKQSRKPSKRLEGKK